MKLKLNWSPGLTMGQHFNSLHCAFYQFFHVKPQHITFVKKLTILMHARIFVLSFVLICGFFRTSFDSLRIRDRKIYLGASKLPMFLSYSFTTLLSRFPFSCSTKKGGELTKRPQYPRWVVKLNWSQE